MTKCSKVKELIITTHDSPGMLAEITSAISEKGVNIEGICAYAMEGKAIFYMITENNQKAKEACVAKNWPFEESDVVTVELPDIVGAAKEMGKKLKAKNVNLKYCYGTTADPKKGGKAKIVLRSDDNDKIIDALK
ncbi:MAG: ACT domain-containing protein [Candidatus Omnitrophota bacterium]